MNFGPAALALEAVERLLQDVDAHPVGVHLDLHDVGLVGAEGRDGAGVGRRLGDDHVARVDERLADEVDDLLAAGRDQHVLRVDVRALGLHDLRDGALGRGDALRRPVLQRLRASRPRRRGP